MNLPPFVKSLAFWKAFSLIVATLVAYYTPYKLEAAILETLIYAVLNLFGIVPELRARGIL